MRISLVLTSVSTRGQAAKIANELVKQRLAACVSFWPAGSVYRWKGTTEKSNEFALEIKTARPSAVSSWLKKNHPYSLPMILTLAARASPAYAAWAHKR